MGQAGTYSVVVSNFVGMVTNTVARVQISLHVDYAVTQTNGQWQFRVQGTVSQPVVLQQSTNLSAWVPVFTNAMAHTPFTFLDTAMTNQPSRFYRALPWP